MITGRFRAVTVLSISMISNCIWSRTSEHVVLKISVALSISSIRHRRQSRTNAWPLKLFNSVFHLSIDQSCPSNRHIFIILVGLTVFTNLYIERDLPSDILQPVYYHNFVHNLFPVNRI